MKNAILIISAFLIAHIAFAQNVTLKHDTIFTNKTPYALFKKGKAKPLRYFVCDLNGNELMEVHNGRIEIKGQPGYVVNFLNDMKQGMIIKDAHFPMSFINEVVSYHLIARGTIINVSELQFIVAHPLPDGYTDVEQLIEY